ncbi:hypothetical protein FQZ97_674030 [compost metagenome]
MRVAQGLVVAGGALAELAVLASAGILVVAHQGGGQAVRVHAQGAGQLLRGLGSVQVAGFHQCAVVHRARPRQAHAVAAHGVGIADQPAGCIAFPLHGLDETVVGVRLVGEALSGPVDGDDARLGAVGDQVREALPFASGAAQLRDRRPEEIGGQAFAGGRSHRRAKGQGRTVVAGRGHGQVLAAGVRTELRGLLASGEAAHGADHAGAGVQLERPAFLAHPHAADAALVEDQRFGAAVQPQLDALGKGGGGQAGDQRVAHRQARAARMAEAVEAIAGQQFQAMPERPG